MHDLLARRQLGARLHRVPCGPLPGQAGALKGRDPVGETVFRRLSEELVPRVARFHVGVLGGKLAGLGPSFVRWFHRDALRLPDTIGWVALREDEVVGFVLGSADGADILGRIVRGRPARWLARSLASAVGHPRAFARAAASLLSGEGPPPGPPGQAELHYIAVRQDQRGLRIGEGLARRFAEDLVARGGGTFALCVARDNVQALRFYEKLGGRPTGEHRAAGSVLCRLAFDARRVLAAPG